MGANSKRDLLTLECPICHRRNYTMTKNKRLHPDRVSYKKYCPDARCRKRTLHVETK